MKKELESALNITLDEVEYIVEFRAQAERPSTFSDPGERFDYEIEDAFYVKHGFPQVPHSTWEYVENEYCITLRDAVLDRIKEIEDGYE